MQLIASRRLTRLILAYYATSWIKRMKYHASGCRLPPDGPCEIKLQYSIITYLSFRCISAICSWILHLYKNLDYWNSSIIGLLWSHHFESVVWSHHEYVSSMCPRQMNVRTVNLFSFWLVRKEMWQRNSWTSGSRCIHLKEHLNSFALSSRCIQRLYVSRRDVFLLYFYCMQWI